MKRLIALLLACLMPLCAFGEEFEGVTVSGRITPVQSASGGILQGLDLVPGQVVKAGELLAYTRFNRLFATQDGTITKVEAKEGLENNGLAVSLAPVSRYLVYCTIDGGYDLPENDWITIDQEVFVRCSKNGTHMGFGRVISIDGEKFNVEMTAGEMYVGEAVQIFRDRAAEMKDRLGVGTVVSTADESYHVNGTVITVNVSAGEEVERGQLLLTWADDSDLTVVSPVDGIVTELPHANGENLTKD